MSRDNVLTSKTKNRWFEPALICLIFEDIKVLHKFSARDVGLKKFEAL